MGQEPMRGDVASAAMIEVEKLHAGHTPKVSVAENDEDADDDVVPHSSFVADGPMCSCFCGKLFCDEPFWVALLFMGCLGLIYLGNTDAPYRNNLIWTLVRAVLWAPMIAIASALLIAVLFCFAIGHKYPLPRDAAVCDVRRCGVTLQYDDRGRLTLRSKRRLYVVIVALVTLVIIVWPISSVTLWVDSKVVENTFGAPDTALEKTFFRSVPYSYWDHLFQFHQPTYNPYSGRSDGKGGSSNKKCILTNTYKFKSLPKGIKAPCPRGDALKSVNVHAQPDKSKGIYTPPDKPDLYLDLFHPSSVHASERRDPPSARSKPAPLIFHMHGGAFLFFDKSDSASPFGAYQRQGYAVVSAQYRMIPYGWSGSDLAADVVDAYRWVRANHAELNID